MQIRLNVQIEFNGKTANKNKWKCENNLELSTKHFRDVTVPKLTNILGYRKEKIWLSTGCMNDKCFLTPEPAYGPMPAQWKEPGIKGCDPPSTIWGGEQMAAMAGGLSM